MPLFEQFLAWIEPRDPKQLDLFARVGGLGVTVISMALAAALCITFWEEAAAQGIVLWLTALLLSRFALYRISMRFQRASAQQRAANRYWPLIATGCAVIAALLWGMAGFAFMAPQNAFAETMLHLVLVTVVFLAVPNLANYYPTVVAYATGVFMPLAARNFMIGGEFHVLLGALCLLASVYVMLNGKSQARAIAAALSQQRVNSELVQALRRENDAVNAARTAAESANASKSRFFAAANHDLRQPLHAIGLLAYTLRTQGSKAEVQTLAQTIEQCVGNMSAMMDELIELSKLDSLLIVPELAPFALQSVLQELHTTFAPQAAAKKLALQFDPMPLTILSDSRLVSRILANLLSNAIRYTPSGSVQLQLAKVDDQVQVTVRDTGIGIAPNDQERIFEEFYQAGNPERDRSKGSGLGLATVRRLCGLLGLTVTVQSALRQGSAFSLNLPLAGASAQRTLAAAQLPTPNVDDTAHLAGRTILVIEDDGAAREAMHRMLAAWGCDVYPACSAQGALNLIKTGLVPEFVVADLRLSGKMNGCDAVQRLHEKLDQHIPAVVVTGDYLSEMIAHVEAANIPLLPKPVDPELLRAIMVEALSPHPTGTAR